MISVGGIAFEDWADYYKKAHGIDMLEVRWALEEKERSKKMSTFAERNAAEREKLRYRVTKPGNIEPVWFRGKCPKCGAEFEVIDEDESPGNLLHFLFWPFWHAIGLNMEKCPTGECSTKVWVRRIYPPSKGGPCHCPNGHCIKGE